MTRDEFTQWLSHFATRFPATGAWMMTLTDETMSAWFDDVFASLELRDCIAVNVSIVATGELEAYQRERIPAMFLRRCQELSYARRVRETSTAEESQGQRHSLRAAAGGAFRAAIRRIAEAKQSGSDCDVSQIVDECLSQWDDSDDDDLRGRYKCKDCRDSGLLSYRDEHHRPYCGHCHCATGLAKRDAWNSRGRTLGPARQAQAVEWSWSD